MFAEGVAGGESKARILVVDDDPLVLRSYARLLGAAGHLVDTVEDPTKAIRQFCEHRYDLVLSDVAMPGMNGIGLLRAIREYDLDVAVMLVTGGPSLETAMEAVELGAFRYLRKGDTAEMLEQAVRKAIAVTRAARIRRNALSEIHGLDRQIGDYAGLEAKFDRALKELWIAFQPIVDWDRREVFAQEALVRSREPTLATPMALLNAAERLGRLPELGRTVRAAVVAAAERLPPTARLFVNLHPNDLNDDELFSPDAPLSRIASRVTLEITERASLESVHDGKEQVLRLRALGFAIALDDIGAGYAGLSSLTTLEPDVVKLDMTLVRDVHQSETKRRLIRSMVSLCRELQSLTVAEGVESAAERDTLRELGCTHLQGYLFARPEFEAAEPNWNDAALEPRQAQAG